MIAALTIAFLLALSLPALLPRWSQVACGVAASMAAVCIAWAYLLRDLQVHPSGGDGPAFFTIMLLAGVAQIVVLASLLARLLAHGLARAMSPTVRPRVVQALRGAACLVCGVALLGYIGAWAAHTLVVLVAVLGFALWWWSVAVQWAPSPSPQRTAASHAAQL